LANLTSANGAAGASFQESYSGANWDQVGSEVSMITPGDVFFNYVWGQGITFTQERVYHQLP
jgi:hypothetical protein